MSKTVKVDDLQKSVLDYLQNYKEDIDEDVVEAVNTVAKQARDELKRTSPRRRKIRNNQYYKVWAIKLSKRKTGVYRKVIWNKTNYQLTHLLEFGHATKNGGRTKPIPHIRPVEQKYNVEFIDLLEKKIRRTSK